MLDDRLSDEDTLVLDLAPSTDTSVRDFCILSPDVKLDWLLEADRLLPESLVLAFDLLFPELSMLCLLVFPFDCELASTGPPVTLAVLFPPDTLPPVTLVSIFPSTLRCLRPVIECLRVAAGYGCRRAVLGNSGIAAIPVMGGLGGISAVERFIRAVAVDVTEQRPAACTALIY